MKGNRVFVKEDERINMGIKQVLNTIFILKKRDKSQVHLKV